MSPSGAPSAAAAADARELADRAEMEAGPQRGCSSNAAVRPGGAVASAGAWQRRARTTEVRAPAAAEAPALCLAMAGKWEVSMLIAPP